MWRFYLEVTVLVLLAFAIGAGLAAVVVRRLVREAPPGDELPEPATDASPAEVAP